LVYTPGSILNPPLLVLFRNPIGDEPRFYSPLYESGANARKTCHILFLITASRATEDQKEDDDLPKTSKGSGAQG